MTAEGVPAKLAIHRSDIIELATLLTSLLDAAP